METPSNIAGCDVLEWYRTACVYVPLMGIFLGVGGSFIGQGQLLGLPFLIATAVLCVQHLLNPTRKQVKIFARSLPSRENAIIGTSLQALFMFGMVFAISCARISLDGLSNPWTHSYLYQVLLFGGYGFYGQYHMMKYLKQKTSAC